MRARKAAQDAEGAKQAARETQSKAALVKALQARAEPLVGSPAAAYLASRGIHALPEMWSYLPPVQGLDVLSPHRPALVAWAVNAAGQVTGGQRVLILEDGSKAPEEPRKVAFGSIGGNAAKIRAQVAGAPQRQRQRLHRQQGLRFGQYSALAGLPLPPRPSIGR
jgi:hypothetical protein